VEQRHGCGYGGEGDPITKLAEQEAARLNELNKEKRSLYTVQVTRFVESLEA
jgi:hypothetical protein